MWGKLRDRLIADARYWYKMWSSWLAIAFGTLVTIAYTNPTGLNEIINVLPPETRAKLSPVVFIIASGLPIVVRLWKQRDPAA